MNQSQIFPAMEAMSRVSVVGTLTLLLVLLFPAPARAQYDIVSIDALESENLLGKYVHIAAVPQALSEAAANDSVAFFFRHIENSMETSAAEADQRIVWEKNTSDKVKLASDNHLNWLYFDIVNTSSVARQFMLELDDFQLVSWFYRDHRQTLVMHKDDVLQPLYDRPIVDTTPILPLDLQPGVRYRIFISTYIITGQAWVSLKLRDVETFRQQRMTEYLIDGIYFGFLGALIIYNLFLFFSLRQNVYFFLAAFQTSICLTLFFAKSYADIFLLQNHLSYFLPLFVPTLSLDSISLSLFVVSLLKIRENHQRLFRLWLVAIIISTLHIPLSIYLSMPDHALPPYQGALRIEANFAFLSFSASAMAIYIIAISVFTARVFWHRSFIARYWLMATSLYFLALFLWLAIKNDGSDPGFDPVYIVQLVTLVDAAMLSGILAFQLKESQYQRMLAQQEALENLRLANEAEEVKSNFISMVGHDLRQPVQAISFFIEALKQSASTRKRSILTKIENNISSVSVLLNRLLELSRARGSAASVTSENFPVSELVNSLKNEFEASAAAKNISLTILAGDSYLNTDKVCMAQILRNLVDNAIKYTREGCVEIEFTEVADKVRISVQDSGIGIPEQELGRIFNEFYQVNKDGDPHRSGLGLGLAIVKRLASALNIDLELQSDPARGTRFELLVDKGSATAKAGSRVKPDVFALPEFRALIVERDDTIAESLSEMIKNWGGKADCCASVDLAWEQLGQGVMKPDLIIADAASYLELSGLPYQRGTNTAGVSEFPAIVLSSSRTEAPEMQRSAGHYYLLHLPVQPLQVRYLIQKCLKQRPEVLAQ